MNLVSREEYENYLKHEGVPNMHWGVRNGPPYPLDRTATGQISKKQEKAAAKIARKEAKAEVKSARKADNKAVRVLKKGKDINPDRFSDEEKEAIKKQVSRSKDVKLMRKYSNFFTTDELRLLAERVKQEQSLKDLQESKLSKGMDLIKKGTNYANTLINAVDAAQKVTKIAKDISGKPEELAKEQKKKEILASKDWSRLSENIDMFKNSEISDFIKRRQNEDIVRKKARDADEAFATKQKKARQDREVADLDTMIDELVSNLDKEFKK